MSNEKTAAYIENPAVRIGPDANVYARYMAETPASDELMYVRFGDGDSAVTLKLPVRLAVCLIGALSSENAAREEYLAAQSRCADVGRRS